MLHDLAVSLDFCFINLGRVHSFRLRDSLLSVLQSFPFRIEGKCEPGGVTGRPGAQPTLLERKKTA